MDTTTGKELPKNTLPFNNLFLNSGFVSGFNEWWMYLVTILVTIASYAAGQLLIASFLIMHAEQRGVKLGKILEDANKLFDYEFMRTDKNIMLVALLGMFVVTAAGFILCIRYLHKKVLVSIFSGYERFRFGRFWFSFGIWGSLLALTVLVSYALNPGEFTVDFQWQGFLISTVVMFIFMPVQTGFEEVFFRGYLLQGLSQVFKSGLLPLLITSLLFGAAHMSNPEVSEYGWAVMLCYYTFFGLFMGGLSLLDEGLELAFGIHFANNFISSVMVSVPGSVLRTYSIFESKKSEDAYAEIALWFCMAGLSFLIFWGRYRWKNFKLILK